ncbi:MAG: Dihydroneopterin aldolase (EC [uncultured Sulfurovum sp.]|uniref:dihydroneopterin aldolase n=1 Tax=uncultured Sulfurovum sp. TaxID=269237 RepID=A0A6S6TSR4_9BACT|nr:MAG: Dihydroneopterin aldolase (EC [uncultured Sulfurovum sp.]
MTIHVEELTFECIIGILDFERTTTQEVVVNLEIDYQYVKNNFINYAEIITLVQNNMIEKKYYLLETALHKISQNLFIQYPQIETLKLKISKPKIIKNAKVSLSKTFIKK